MTMVIQPILYSFVGLLQSRRFRPGEGRLGYSFHMALHHGASLNLHLIQVICFPAMFIEVLVSLPLSWPGMWHPSALTAEDWRAFTWPIYCIPFWWFVGIGVESAIRIRIVRWPWLILGTLLSAFCLILCGVGFFGEGPAERADSYGLIFGFALWGLLFAVFPASWIRNRRKKAATA
jgi:hypothetical protein